MNATTNETNEATTQANGAPDAATQRIAVVTGAARGIGAAIARRLASDGLAIAVVDLDEGACGPIVQEIRDAGGRALAVGADVADETSVAGAFERIVTELGPPTVLVNNAGILRDGMVHKMSVDDWDAVLGVHLRGAFLMSRALRPHVAAAGWGRIVNLSSTSALGKLGQANYAAAKAGMQGLTKTLAIELGRYACTVNAIAPGVVLTEMTEATAAKLGISFEEFQARAIATIPVGRCGTPEDVAAVASFFVREESSFITGQVLYVAGRPTD